MEKIVWSDELSVGVSMIDEQHKRLVAMINRLITNPGSQTGSEAVSDILTEMTRYAKEHFRQEEELLEANGYPELEQHKHYHKEFRRKTLSFVTGTMADLDGISDVMLHYLKEWLVNHIQKVDKEYGPFLNEKGIR